MTDFTPGRYRGIIVSGVSGQSRNKGTPQVELTFDICSIDNKPSGHRKVSTVYLTEKTLAKTNAILASLGFNGDFDAPTFANTQPTDLELRIEEYNGKPQERWEVVMSAPKLPSDLAQRLSSMYRATAPVPPPAAPLAPPTPPAPPTVTTFAPPPPAVPDRPKWLDGKPKTQAQAWADCLSANNGDQAAATAEWTKAAAEVSKEMGVAVTQFNDIHWGYVSAWFLPF